MTNKELSFRLYDFMMYYKPKGLTENISTFTYVPWFDDHDLECLKKKQWKDVRNNAINKWYIKEAIKEFFKKQEINYVMNS
jgi:hypothetical protein